MIVSPEGELVATRRGVTSSSWAEPRVKSLFILGSKIGIETVSILGRDCSAPSRSTNSAKEAMRPSLISSFDPSPGPWRWRRGEHPALGFHRWLCARGMNDALHGREAWRPPGKRDRGRRREMGSRVSAHHGPGEATLILVRNPGPPASYYVIDIAYIIVFLGSQRLRNFRKRVEAV